MAHEICDTFGRVTKDETTARKHLMFSMRLSYVSCPPYTQEAVREASDDWAKLVGPDTALSDAYALLTAEQRASCRQGIENPALRVTGADGREWWVEANHNLLERLERGDPVGAVDEKQIKRAVGTKVF